MINNADDDPRPRSRVRFLVFGMMFLAVVINYMDRVNFSVSTPKIQQQYGFSISDMGRITFYWSLAYALFNFPGGWLVDRMGMRFAAAAAIGWWSLFTILSPFSSSLAGWCRVRALMGAGESPIWPINAKAASSWSARLERSRAFTIVGSGQFVGPAFGSVLAGWIVEKYGWQWTFISFGILGLVWIPVWLVLVRDSPEVHPRVNQAELDHIREGTGAAREMRKQQHLTRDELKLAVRAMVTRNGAGVFLTFLTFGYVLFTFLNWLPVYMYETFQLSVLKSASWSSLSYLAGFLGFLVSGPTNDWLVKRYGAARGRKIGAGVPMALMIVLVLGALRTSQLHLVRPTVALMGLGLLVMNASVGAWAVNAVDLAPTPRSTAFVYGTYNGVLNLMGAYNSLLVTHIAQHYGFIAAFSSAVVAMAVFLIGLLLVIDRHGIPPGRSTVGGSH